MRRRKLYGAVVMCLTIASCGGSRSAPAPPATHIAPPTAKPTATLSAAQTRDQTQFAVRRLILGPKLNNPSGIAADGAGNVYVADTDDNRIAKFSSTGTFLAQFGGTFSQGRGDLSRPSGAAVDNQGNLYVADTGHNRIQTFSPNGKPLAVWSVEADGMPLKSPTGIAVAPNGSIYVVDSGHNRVVTLSSRGQVTRAWGTQGNHPGQFNQPAGIAVDAQGNVYVADTGNARVQKLSSSGKVKATWNTASTGQMTTPVAVAVARDGMIYVGDGEYPYIYELSSSGYPLQTFYLSGGQVGEGGITASHGGLFGLAVDGRGNIYDTDISGGFGTSVNLAFELAPSGRLLQSFGAKQETAKIGGPGALSSPSGIAVDQAANIYVADAGNARVQKFSPGGQVLAVWPVSGNVLSGQGPADVAVATDGDIYVADSPNKRVVKLSPSGKEIAEWPSSGSGSQVFPESPNSIAVDNSGSSYTINGDTQFANIAKTSPTGQPLAVWGKTGAGPGEFDGPSGIAIDSAGDIYIADTNNARIQKLSPDGLPLAQWTTIGGGLGAFQSPDGVAVAPSGDLYVSDSGRRVIVRLSPKGALKQYWESSGGASSGSSQSIPATGSLNPLGAFSPAALTVDAVGNIYFFESGKVEGVNDRINEIVVLRPGLSGRYATPPPVATAGTGATPHSAQGSTPPATAETTATAHGSLGSQPRSEQGAIIEALHRSNDAYVRSMACACNKGLSAAKTGADLEKYLQSTRELRHEGAYREVTTNSFSIQSIHPETASSASAVVLKDDTSRKYRNGQVVETCTGSYTVDYHLLKVVGTWKVDSSDVAGAGQTCTNG